MVVPKVKPGLQSQSFVKRITEYTYKTLSEKSSDISLHTCIAYHNYILLKTIRSIFWGEKKQGCDKKPESYKLLKKRDFLEEYELFQPDIRPLSQ